MSHDTNSVKADFNLIRQQIEEINRLFTKLYEYLACDEADSFSSYLEANLQKDNFGIEFESGARKCILVSDDTFASSNVPIIASVINQINATLMDLLNRCGYTDPVNTGCSAETPIPLPLPHSSADACTTLSNLSDAYFKQIDSFEPDADDDIGFYTPVFPRQMTNITNTMSKTSDDTPADITEKDDWKRDVLIMLNRTSYM